MIGSESAVSGAKRPFLVEHRGRELIGQPLLNKGTAFSDEERDMFGLRGLLPPRVNTIEEQVSLELEHVRRKADDLERYIGLAALQDRNETLFYRVLAENLEEFLPIVYTPTVGRACQDFSHIFRRPRGVWITPDDLGRIDDILRAAADAEHPADRRDRQRADPGPRRPGCRRDGDPRRQARSVHRGRGRHLSGLDVAGIARRGHGPCELLEDPLYLGYRAPRLRGGAYDEVLEAFVDSVRRVFPAAVVQWEDFKQHNALRILDRYRHRLTSFNDDVQGTGGVVLGGLLAARRETGGLSGERFLFLGAGAAAIGIAGLLHRRARPGRRGICRRRSRDRAHGSAVASSISIGPGSPTTSGRSRSIRAGSPRPGSARRT